MINITIFDFKQKLWNLKVEKCTFFSRFQAKILKEMVIEFEGSRILLNCDVFLSVIIVLHIGEMQRSPVENCW